MRKKIDSMWTFSLLPLAAMGLFMAGNAVAAEDQPTVAKDSIQATAYTFNVYHKSYDIWSWAPMMAFRVNGPIESGGQLYVEYTVPGAAPVKFDCKTGQVQKGRWWKTECGGRDIPEEKASTYTGMVSFAIHIRSELAGTDATLFTGKMKVAKAHSNEHGPKVVNHFVYYVNHDWDMPIGYLFLTASGSSAEWQRPNFNAAFWLRGEVGGGLEPHLFYQGKEVGKIFYGNDEAGKAGCDTKVENGTTHYVDDSLPQKAKWSRAECTFYNVLGWDKTGKTDTFPGQVGSAHVMSANPGDYELKVLWKNHLARSIKFTVGPDGKFDNGIATANKLGSDRVIVPVQIIGDQDGQWDHAAWKTEAFYGNPLKGFTPVP